MGFTGNMFELSVEHINKYKDKSKELGEVIEYEDHDKAMKALKVSSRKKPAKGEVILTSYSGDELDRLVNLYDSLKDKSYLRVAEFCTSGMSHTWMYFGEILEKNYPSAGKYFDKLTYGVSGKNGNGVLSGYLLPEEVKSFLAELEKIDFKKLSSKFKEFLGSQFSPERLKEDFVRKEYDEYMEYFNEYGFNLCNIENENFKFKNFDRNQGWGQHKNILETSKILLKKVIEDKKALCLFMG
jgi:hypothetical protein